MPIAGLEGRALERGADGYEAARRACVWNARTPERMPALVVLAEDEQDVLLAVRHAAKNGMRLGVRSGGHSWAGSHVRNDALLLDVSRLREVNVDPGAMTASVGPGIPGNELLEQLAAHDLFFPAGHCPGVGIGGYLLQGGYGWNGRVHGPACMSVEAIDVVTAAGELVRADAENHADLFWAARGSGPGFFGAVTGFHLRLQRKPKLAANGVHLYAMDALEDVFSWAAEIGPKVPREMEMMLFIHRDMDGEPEIAVTGPVLADSEDEARAALSLLETAPAGAKAAIPYVPAQMADLYAAAHASYPDDHRYAVDNMWTHAPVRDLLPGLRAIGEAVPAAPSHMLWMNWGASPERPDMAYSVEDETYIALYAVWADPADDAANLAWAEDNMRAMDSLASGIQLADENLGRRPARFLSDDNYARFDAIRGRYDPDGLFVGWMGRP